MTILIGQIDASRSFGFDTTQLAVGRLPRSENNAAVDGGDLRLLEVEFKRLMEAMIKAAQETAAKSVQVEMKINGREVGYDVTVSCTRDDSGVDGDLRATREFDVYLKSYRTGYQTCMIVRLQEDTNRAFWLNIRANPSSLALGYNAVGVALPGLKARVERQRILRLPFIMLGQVLRVVEPGFVWKRATAARIRKLQFKVCPVQVFTYGMPAPFEPHQLLGFLRAFLACPVGNGKGDYCVVADLLGIEAETKQAAGSVQTLLLKFRDSGRITWSLNLYDKDADAAAAAGSIKAEVGDEAVRAFLRTHIRFDFTLHDGALRDLMAEAKLDRKRAAMLTAANLNRAIGVLNKKRGKSGQTFTPWLLHQIFGVRLPLLSLLSYKPSLVDEVRAAVIESNPVAGAVFDEWREKRFISTANGKSISFVAFAENWAKSRVSRQEARTIKKRAEAMGLDLDVPLPAYEAIYIMRHYFDLNDNDRHNLAVALEARNAEGAMKLMRRSNKNTAETVDKLRGALATMIATPKVPAIELAAPAPAAAQVNRRRV